jgi:hypothetical protein
MKMKRYFVWTHCCLEVLVPWISRFMTMGKKKFNENAIQNKIFSSKSEQQMALEELH